MFTSTLRPGEFIVDDDNFHGYAPQLGTKLEGNGYLPRDYSKDTYGSLPYLETFDLPIIPRSEWPARIEEMERTKTRLSDFWIAANLDSPYQNGIPYCWIYAVATAMTTLRLTAGLPFVRLSAESAGARITGFRSVGGWSHRGVEWVVQHGMNTEDEWPKHRAGINRRYDTPENRESAKRNIVHKWYDVPDRNFAALMTCLFHRIPVCIGLNWWRHAICGLDPVMTGRNSFGVRIQNSHGNGYGDRGRAVLSESRGTPDDAVAPIAMAASVK